MKTKVAIVTDSTSDIPLDMAAERQIYIAPMNIIWGQQSYKDSLELSREAFYERLPRDPELPSTSQPSPGEFADLYQRARDETDAEAVVAITISAELSGTHSSAQQAQKMVDFPVHLVDARTTSGALGLHTLAVADLRDEGAPLETVIQQAQAYAQRTRAILTINTLEFLYRSGRVSAARRWIGAALQIKPILYVKDGRMEALEAVRHRGRALSRMLEIFNSWIDPTRPVHIAILYGDTPENADEYEAILQETWQPVRMLKLLASSAVGVHTGPGAMGLTLFQ
jgi:DegV family protein with EDD domain